MKSCPTCNRTFEDTFTFCLADGALLSAPFDPQATVIIPDARNTNPPPTEVMPQEPSPNNAALPSTIVSQSPAQKAPASPQDKKEVKKQKILKGAVLGASVGFVVGLIGVALKVKANSFDVISSTVVVGIIIGALIGLTKKE